LAGGGGSKQTRAGVEYMRTRHKLAHHEKQAHFGLK
jgi:hypothetical protein